MLSLGDFETKKNILWDADPDSMVLEGFDDAFIGIGTMSDGIPRAIYDRDKMLQIIALRDGGDYEDGIEEIYRNILGCLVGVENCPVVVESFERQ